MASRRYLCPNDEDEWAHAKATIRQFGAVVFGYVGVVIVIAAAAAPSSFALPKDNIYNTTWESILDEAFSSSTTWIINRKGRNVTFEREKFLKDRLMRRLGMKRIDFGTTWNTYCWNDPPPEAPFLPSLLRIFEFRPLTQAFMRLTVLLTIIWRLVFIYFRLADLKAVETRPLPLLRSVASIGPWIALADCFSSLSVLLLHQDADNAYRDLMPISLVLFGIFSCLHMIAHLLIDFLSKNRSMRVFLRVLCLATVMAALPYAIQLQLDFLRRKTCTPYVPLLSALPDYIVFLSLVIFAASLMFESPQVIMILSALPLEFSDYYDYPDRYKPAMNSDS